MLFKSRAPNDVTLSILKTPAKNIFDNSVCFCRLLHMFVLHYLTKLSIEKNSVDPDQTDLDLHCLMERLLTHFSRRQKQTTYFAVIGVLRVNGRFIDQ